MGPISRVCFRHLHSREVKTRSTGDPETQSDTGGFPRTCAQGLVPAARSGEVIVACYSTERTGHFKVDFECLYGACTGSATLEGWHARKYNILQPFEVTMVSDICMGNETILYGAIFSPWAVG